jgi:hypothetical protein
MFCVLRMEPETSPNGVVVSCYASVAEARAGYDRHQDSARAVGSSPDILRIVEVAYEMKPGRAVRPDMIVRKISRVDDRAIGNDYDD